jgi:hypothetical protein
MKHICHLFIFIAFSYLFSGCGVTTNPVNPTPVNPTLPSNTTFVPASFKSLRIKNANVVIRKGTTTGYYITKGINVDATNEYRQYIKINSEVFEYEPIVNGFLSTPTITLIMSNLSNIYAYEFGKVVIYDEFTVADMQITTQQNSKVDFKANITANSFNFLGRNFGDLTMENLEVRTLTKIDVSKNVNLILNGNLVSENLNITSRDFGDITINKSLLISKEFKIDLTSNVDFLVQGDIKANTFLPVMGAFASINAQNFRVEQNFTLNLHSNTDFKIKNTITTPNGFIVNLRDFAEITANTLTNSQNLIIDMADNSDFKINNITVANLTVAMRDFAEIVANNLIAQKIVCDMRSNADFKVITLKASDMSYQVTNFSRLNIANINNTNLTKIVFADNSTVNLKGKTTTLDIESTATKETDFYLLNAENVIVKSYSNTFLTSHLKIFASKSIDATISNKWNIYYKGSPSTIKTNYTSTGRLINAN